MKYTVYLYPIVMVKVEGVEAPSQAEAIRKAENDTDLHALFDHIPNASYAEDIDAFHVDEENDPLYERSCWYDKQGVPL